MICPTNKVFMSYNAHMSLDESYFFIDKHQHAIHFIFIFHTSHTQNFLLHTRNGAVPQRHYTQRSRHRHARHASDVNGNICVRERGLCCLFRAKFVFHNQRFYSSPIPILFQKGVMQTPSRKKTAAHAEMTPISIGWGILRKGRGLVCRHPAKAEGN